MAQVIGIDPGPKYTAVVVRDGMEVLHSATYVRPADMEPITWAIKAVGYVKRDVIDLYPDLPIGIEGVTTPGSHLNGKISLINPKHLIRLSFVVGAFAMAFPHAVIIKAGKNGKQPLDTYPAALKGTRPKSLAGVSKGAGTRNHEKSAFDVAGFVEEYTRAGYTLDMIKNLFDD